jgi:hypothetical protein
MSDNRRKAYRSTPARAAIAPTAPTQKTNDHFIRSAERQAALPRDAERHKLRA